MATMVYFDKIWDYDNKIHIFRSFDGESLWIESFNDGIAIADPLIGTSFLSYAKLIAGCFKKGSNFKQELFKAFNLEKETIFKGIQFEFNEVTILVTKENANKTKICTEYKEGLEANERKHRLEQEAYMKTPEYKMRRAKQLKKHIRTQTVEKDVLLTDIATELEFKDIESQEKWEKWVKVNSRNGYGDAIVNYASRWAKYMQHIMKKHNKSIYKIAKETSRVSDIEGITGYMYGVAVGMLSEYWRYGEELRKWHNKEREI